MPRVNPEILSWARKTAGFSQSDAVEKLGINDARGVAAVDRLAAIESGARSISSTFGSIVAIPGYKFIQASWQNETFSVDIFQGAIFWGFCSRSFRRFTRSLFSPPNSWHRFLAITVLLDVKAYLKSDHSNGGGS